MGHTRKVKKDAINKPFKLVNTHDKHLQIAVPSFRRFERFVESTYALLKRHDLLDISTVFINQEDYDTYSALKDIKIVVKDTKTLQERRDYIYAYYPTGTHIVQLDDDIKSIIGMDKKEVASFKSLLETGFSLCEKEGCRFWGLYPVANPFYMKEGYTTKLAYIGGVCLGFVKKGDYASGLFTAKSDFYWSCWYYTKDSKIVRINQYAPVCNYYTAKGGRSDERRRQDELEGAKIVVRDFPQFATMYIRKTSGYAELRLREKQSDH